MQTITITKAAKRLGVSYYRLRKWVDAGIMPTKVFPDGQLRVEVDELTRFYASLPAGAENRKISENDEISA